MKTRRKAGEDIKLTDACTPDCLSAWISSTVRGCTNSPSLMSSFVASVSSENERSSLTSKTGKGILPTNFVQRARGHVLQLFVIDFIGQAIWLANKFVCVEATKFPNSNRPEKNFSDYLLETWNSSRTYPCPPSRS